MRGCQCDCIPFTTTSEIPPDSSMKTLQQLVRAASWAALTTSPAQPPGAHAQNGVCGTRPIPAHQLAKKRPAGQPARRPTSLLVMARVELSMCAICASSLQPRIMPTGLRANTRGPRGGVRDAQAAASASRCAAPIRPPGQRAILNECRWPLTPPCVPGVASRAAADSSA